MVEKYLSLPLFLSFLPFLYLLQSVPFCTKAGGLAMMRGDHLHKPNQHHLPLPLSYSFCLLYSLLPSCTIGAQLSSLPKVHLSKLSTCCSAIKTWPSVSCFKRATFLCHASPGTPERAKDIPLRCFFPLENLREWLSLTKTTPLHFLPCVNLILLFYITKLPQAGRDWLNECYPFKISIPGNSYYMCFDYGVMYKREKYDKAKKDWWLKETG